MRIPSSRKPDIFRTFQRLEAFRAKYLGRKGLIQEIYASLSTLPHDQRPGAGKSANDLRDNISVIIETKQKEIKSLQAQSPAAEIDITIPGVAFPVGHQHILTQTVDEICGIFEGLGFVVQEGPEIETEFNNFTALNIPVDHPSRDAFDTFYLELPDPRASGALSTVAQPHVARSNTDHAKKSAAFGRDRPRTRVPSRRGGRQPLVHVPPDRRAFWSTRT